MVRAEDRPGVSGTYSAAPDNLIGNGGPSDTSGADPLRVGSSQRLLGLFPDELISQVVHRHLVRALTVLARSRAVLNTRT